MGPDLPSRAGLLRAMRALRSGRAAAGLDGALGREAQSPRSPSLERIDARDLSESGLEDVAADLKNDRLKTGVLFQIPTCSITT